jgi:hypothetical protein
MAIEKVDTPAPILTNDQLLKMLIDSQKEQAKANELLAQALLESRKPYVDPAVLEQKKRDLEERKRQVAIVQEQRVATKQACPHTRTDSEGTFGDVLNIKWQEHSNGIILGVCGTCFSQFDARNPKDLALLRKDGKAQKNMGRARENVRLGM